MPPFMKATILLLFSAAAVFAQSPDKVPEGLASSDWGSIRAAYEAGQHEVRAVVGEKGVFEGKNPGQQWRTRFDGRGFTATPSTGGWTWGLELESYGWAGVEQAVTGTPRANASGTRFTYDWSDSMQEWYLNDQRGLEHGFFIKERPTSGNEAELSFKMKVRGGLRPEISGDARAVNFLDANGATVLNYGGLKVWDADDKPLPARFEATSDGGFRFLVDERGARYPITIDPVAQQAYLKASNAGAGDQFGFSVAASENTVVIGSPYEDSSTTGVNSTANEGSRNSGAAYVFIRTGSTWTQQAYLKANNTADDDKFGNSVAISGNTIVVGAFGENGIGSNAGAAYVFVRSGSTWVQQQYLKAGNAGSNQLFGWSVAISGNSLVVGATLESSSSTGVNSTPNNGAQEAGAAYVFNRSGTVWTQQAYLKASNSDAFDNFGHSVSISGDTVVVGAPREDSNPGSPLGNTSTSAGAAYVYTRSAASWTYRAFLKGPSDSSDSVFGRAVGISGNTIVVGAPNFIGGGRAFVFVGGGTTWLLQATLGGDRFKIGQGASVAISGDRVLVGSRGITSFSSSDVQIYTRQGSSWAGQHIYRGYYRNGTYGTAVGLSGDLVAIGDYGDISGSVGINSTPLQRGS